MSCGIIADNWSLQHVVGLLSQGLSGNDAHFIRVSKNDHRYNPLSEAIVQTEALFDLLTEIVLRDEIIVDAAFTETWDSGDNPLHALRDSGILRTVPFLELESKFSSLRETLADRLCVTDSLKHEHTKNVEGWRLTGEPPNPFLSAVLWGGAGMVARSSVFQSSYCPHPLRRRFFIATGLFLDGNSAYSKLNSVISEKRLLLAKKTSSADQLYALHVSLPPIPIRVIEQSSAASDFVKVALQLRPDFQSVREWLKLTEEAIVNDDLKTVHSQYKLLDDIAMHVDRILGRKSDAITLSAGIGFLTISAKINPASSLRNRFGVRSVLNKLIFDASGWSALSKYCQIFGESGTEKERALQEYFSTSK